MVRTHLHGGILDGGERVEWNLGSRVGDDCGEAIEDPD